MYVTVFELLDVEENYSDLEIYVKGHLRSCHWKWHRSIHCVAYEFFGVSISRVSILTSDIDIANLSLCLSVCP